MYFYLFFEFIYIFTENNHILFILDFRKHV